ncbi:MULTISPECIES: D-aminoacyl-tRNA deacylase [Sorangium]|uniref:D-aminoacyl-tRNA deacylase n=3 Tax=Sorangium cellulosum TaxID=56 RepID=A0A150U1E2_SORCE|nr:MULTISPECIES: D-aminoacyl-tRNA deacylase [Sorangium]AGP39808.1 D-tyrosyl-tRNA(Tyr) deacylase [Sorangium cellulosum So0157-2]KYG10775.1 D-tyrosyl-tRNA(Tyr) deacylase [Sorangium cellulosum]WCQ95053.1 D-aminoacyl-tRNA deacylase [Sorangium sp. Soce836]
MRAVVQRALAARVEVDGQVVGAIERGLVAFVGAAKDDDEADADHVANKVAGLRVFSDEAGKMSRALADVRGGVLAISQFTLFGDVRRGLRPSFDGAMEPARAEALYERFVAALRARGLEVATGRFRADMRVFVENDGPVTILIDSKRTF